MCMSNLIHFQVIGELFLEISDTCINEWIQLKCYVHYNNKKSTTPYVDMGAWKIRMKDKGIRKTFLVANRCFAQLVN